MRQLTLLLVGLASLGSLARPAAAAVSAQPSLLQSELIAERQTVAPGSQVTLALRQHLAPGWHTYWRNPGNIGQATRVAWTLPQGWQAGDIRWPTPQVYHLGSETNFVYSGEVVLPVTLTVPTHAPIGPARLQAVVSALLCRDVCIPTRETVSIPLQVAARPGPAGPDAPAIAETLRRLSARTRVTGVFASDGHGLTLALPGLAKADRATFFPLEGQGLDTNAPMRWRSAPQGAALSLALKAGAAPPAHLRGLVSRPGAPDVEVEAARGALPAWQAKVTAAPTTGGGARLIGFILLAFGGGLVLNAMPCVFPVLAAKVATIASGAGVRAARREALAYALGALAAFLVLAGLLIGLRASGQALGWGFQLQSPLATAILALVMTASALNLAGLFEAGLWLQRQAGAARIGASDLGAFLTGALAALVAAPCTAPLMAPAVGWALTQPAPAALAVFGAIGLGLAAPFLVFAWIPGAARLLPRPGAWLARLRQALAFPMLAGAAWLVWVFAVERGPAGLPGLLAALIALAFALWCWGASQAVARPFRWRMAAAISAAALIPAGLYLGAAGPASGAAAAPVSETWSPQRVDALLAEGHPVLVDVSAAWCITCKVNETVALDSAPARQAMREAGARLLKADWTQPDAAIEAFLAAHGRSGVPFYLLYAPDGRKIELPQVLTPQTVAAALKSAARKEN